MAEPVNQVNFLNWWSLVHFCFWAAVTGLVWKRARSRVSLGQVLLLSLVGAYVWEVVEYFVAVLPVLWKLTESGMNRWVSDPLMALIAVPFTWYAAEALKRGGPHHQHA